MCYGFNFSSLNLRSFGIEKSGRKQQQQKKKKQKHDENHFKKMFWKSLGAKLLKSWKQFLKTLIENQKGEEFSKREADVENY